MELNNISKKRLLLTNLKELYLEFLKQSQEKICFSKFCQLRPKWCITVNSALGVHSVFVCEIHQNTKLLAAAIPHIKDYKDLLSVLVCDVTSGDCMLYNCDTLDKLLMQNDFLENDLVTDKLDEKGKIY